DRSAHFVAAYRLVDKTKQVKLMNDDRRGNSGSAIVADPDFTRGAAERFVGLGNSSAAIAPGKLVRQQHGVEMLAHREPGGPAAKAGPSLCELPYSFPDGSLRAL